MMKNKYVSIISILLSQLITSNIIAQTTHEIVAQGLTYSPSALTILAGDKVVFNVGPTHPTLEVNQATWEANGSEAMQGGFNFPGGSGEIVFQSPGIYYYICTSHIASGMKGKIEVSSVTAAPEITDIAEKLLVYPNPLIDNNLQIEFYIKEASAFSFRLIDLNGTKVLEMKDLHMNSGDNHVMINTENIRPGYYIFEAITNDLQFHTRILKIY